MGLNNIYDIVCVSGRQIFSQFKSIVEYVQEVVKGFQFKSGEGDVSLCVGVGRRRGGQKSYQEGFV